MVNILVNLVKKENEKDYKGHSDKEKKKPNGGNEDKNKKEDAQSPTIKNQD